MAQKLESTNGGGRSIKIGTTGTVAALITQELDSMKASPKKIPLSRSNRTIPVSIDCRPSSSSSSPPLLSSYNRSSNGINRIKTPKGHVKNSHSLPMLGPDNDLLHETPRKDKRTKNIVEIVDVNCGKTDRPWASPLTSRLKKLGFTRVSQTSRLTSL